MIPEGNPQRSYDMRAVHMLACELHLDAGHQLGVA